MSETSPTPVHITSLVVHAVPDHWERVLSQVAEIPAVAIHTGDTVGKFVVLLETDNEQQILEAMNRIQDVEGVLNASMVYHHIDE